MSPSTVIRTTPNTFSTKNQLVQFSFQDEFYLQMISKFNALYPTNNDFYLRKLTFRSTNAIDQIRHISNKDISTLECGTNSFIEFFVNKKTLAISDSGLGMTKANLANDLRTIAHYERKNQTADNWFYLFAYDVIIYNDDDEQCNWELDSSDYFSLVCDEKKVEVDESKERTSDAKRDVSGSKSLKMTLMVSKRRRAIDQENADGFEDEQQRKAMERDCVDALGRLADEKKAKEDSSDANKNALCRVEKRDICEEQLCLGELESRAERDSCSKDVRSASEGDSEGNRNAKEQLGDLKEKESVEEAPNRDLEIGARRLTTRHGEQDRADDARKRQESDNQLKSTSPTTIHFSFERGE